MSRTTLTSTQLGANHYIGGIAVAVGDCDAPKAVEQSQSEAVLYRIKSAIEYGHALAERLESLESRINGAKPQPVPTEGGAVGYGHSLAGEMQRTADTAEYLTKRLEEVITSLERFA